jgi:hypothetical protein
MSVIIPNLKLSGAPKVKWSNPLTKGLVGYWPLSEGAGGVARDIAGGNHGTLVGGVSQAVGRHGRALGFDGLNGTHCDAIALNDLSVYLPWTVSVWVKVDSTVSTQYILSNPVALADRIHVYFRASGYTFVVATFTSSYTVLGKSIGYTAAIGKWVHVLCANTPGLSIYVNALAGGDPADAVVSSTIGRLHIGGRVSSAVLGGQLSNVSIHNRALTPTEIKLLYERPLAMIDDSVELWSPAVEAAAPRRAHSLSPLAGTLTPLAR